MERKSAVYTVEGTSMAFVYLSPERRLSMLCIRKKESDRPIARGCQVFESHRFARLRRSDNNDTHVTQLARQLTEKE